MTEREALKLALEALEKYARDFGSSDLTVKAMYVVRQALAQPEQELIPIADYMNLMEKYVALLSAQPEQEPVAWMEKDVLPLTHIIKAIVRREKDETYTEPLYTTPPQRTWVGLTPENYNEIFEQARTGEHAVQLAEAKLKEKNT